MPINKWSPPAGGTGMGGNSTPRNLHSNEGGGGGGEGGEGGGEQRWGPPICSKFISFLIFTLNLLSIVVILGKVTLARRKNIVYFLYLKTQGIRRFSSLQLFYTKLY